jgi:hypothetical protein
MRRPSWAVDEDIVKVNHNKFSHKRPQNLMHESHKSAGGVGQPKRHHHPLVQTMLRLDHYLPLISRPYSDLVVAGFKVNFLEDLKAEQLI